MIDFNHNFSSRVDWMLGACLLVRREFLSDVGLMDEGYYLYVEDIDWCYRAKEADWEVWYFSDAYFIHHHLAESDRRLFGRMSWHHYRSMFRFYAKHLAPDWARLIVKTEILQDK
jgi:GT2 family glycosyltransferase